jgi:hypothetical protein
VQLFQFSRLNLPARSPEIRESHARERGKDLQKCPRETSHCSPRRLCVIANASDVPESQAPRSAAQSLTCDRKRVTGEVRLHWYLEIVFCKGLATHARAQTAGGVME